MLDLKIITGMSGAGKSQFLRMMEDLGFYVVDHLPLELIGDFIRVLASDDRRVEKAAIAVDIRENGHFDDFFTALGRMDELQVKKEIIYLEASRDVLMRRFRETRRRHPLDVDLRILAAIEAEEKIMAPIRAIADRIIDTSHLSSPQMQELVGKLFAPGDKPRLMVNVVSFGFKHGIPHDVDFLYDVRFLPNPFYEPELKAITGLEEAVRDYVLKDRLAVEFLTALEGFIPFILNSFEAVLRDHIVIGVGCTGGQHRSVVMAEELRHLAERAGFTATVSHRDLPRAW